MVHFPKENQRFWARRPGKSSLTLRTATPRAAPRMGRGPGRAGGARKLGPRNLCRGKSPGSAARLLHLFRTPIFKVLGGFGFQNLQKTLVFSRFWVFFGFQNLQKKHWYFQGFGWFWGLKTWKNFSISRFWVGFGFQNLEKTLVFSRVLVVFGFQNLQKTFVFPWFSPGLPGLAQLGKVQKRRGGTGKFSLGKVFHQSTRLVRRFKKVIWKVFIQKVFQESDPAGDLKKLFPITKTFFESKLSYGIRFGPLI